MQRFKGSQRLELAAWSGKKEYYETEKQLERVISGTFDIKV